MPVLPYLVDQTIVPQIHESFFIIPHTCTISIDTICVPSNALYYIGTFINRTKNDNSKVCLNVKKRMRRQRADSTVFSAYIIDDFMKKKEEKLFSFSRYTIKELSSVIKKCEVRRVHLVLSLTRDR